MQNKTVYFNENDGLTITYDDLINYKKHETKYRAENEEKSQIIDILLEGADTSYYENHLKRINEQYNKIFRDLQKYISDKYDVYYKQDIDHSDLFPYYILENPKTVKLENELNKIKASWFYKIGKLFYAI